MLMNIDGRSYNIHRENQLTPQAEESRVQQTHYHCSKPVHTVSLSDFDSICRVSSTSKHLREEHVSCMWRMSDFALFL